MSASEPYAVAFAVCQNRRNPNRTGNTPPFNTNLPLPSSTSVQAGPPNVTSATLASNSTRCQLPQLTLAQAQAEFQRVEATCLEITARESCHVSATREAMGLPLGMVPQTIAITPQTADNLTNETPAYNLSISGGYAAVMAARGAAMREAPHENLVTLRVPLSEVLEYAPSEHSAVKPDVLRRLQVIATDTQAHIRLSSVPPSGSSATPPVIHAEIQPRVDDNDASTDGADQTTQAPGHDRTGSGASSLAASIHGVSSSTKQAPNVDSSSAFNGRHPSDLGRSSVAAATKASYGLVAEKQCEIAIIGSMESVELAKVRILVLFDELSGLHADHCEVNYKIQPIIAGRLRVEIQNIQEETSTSIYFPTQLVGVYDAPPAGTQQGVGYHHLAIPTPPVAPISMQPTGQSMYSGHMGMHGPGMGMGMGPGMGMMPHMTGNSAMSNMTHGSFRPPPFPPHGMPGDYRHHPHPPPHYPPQGFDGPPPYPYMPQQPPPGGPPHPRDMPFNGNGDGYGNGHDHGPGPQSHPDDVNLLFAPTNGMGPPHHQRPPPHDQHQHHQAPLQSNHTGMSSMNSFQSSRMSSPMPTSHGQSPMPPPHHMHMHGNGMGFEPHHQLGMGMHGPPHNMYPGHPHPNGGMGGGGMYNGMPYMGHHPEPRFRPEHIRPPPLQLDRFVGTHPGLDLDNGEQGRIGKPSQVWITGEFFGVQRARDMLLQLVKQKIDLVVSRDAALLPRKLDWMLTERLDDLRNIANDNGTYIQVPSVGSHLSSITVFGDHRTSIERTIRSVMALASQMYCASVWLLPSKFDALMPQSVLHPATMRKYLKPIAHATGAELTFKANCFEAHGHELQVRAAVSMILELDIMHNFQHEVRYQIELSNDHRDFITGKKSGKLNKIMKRCGAKIKFGTFNHFNFLLDICGTAAGSDLGLTMLLEEMPAEVSFHLPEAYHKRIIGVGGRNIQRIMKTYGVYIKFSNNEEHAATGGYAENEDNVFARTPAKNHASLEIMKQAVIDMVNTKDRDFTRETLAVPRRYHRTLLGEKSIFVHDIESKTNSSIRFPYRETASDLITIFGPESQAHIAAAMLLEHVPFEADLQVPPNPDLTRLVTSPEFIIFAEQVKSDHQIAISPSPNFGKGEEATFKFRCQRSNIDYLSGARDVFEEWLGQHNVYMYPQNAKKRADTFDDAFSRLEWDLLGGGRKLNDQLSHPRTTVDSNNVKALFEGPVEVNPGFAGPLGLPSATRTTDVWQPSGHAHARSETDTVKRDLEPPVAERVRSVTSQNTTHSPRGQSARTQSLDISSINFSRSLSGSGGPMAFGPIPPSPGGLVSSPSTATGPFFQASGAPTAAPGARYTVDSLADGLSSIQVSHPTP